MRPLFTSFVPAPRCIARSAFARVLAFVLAIVFVSVNGFAAAMPVGEAMAAGAQTSSAHAHCADHALATSPTKHAGHGDDCACGGKACACMHACDALVLAMPAAVPMPATRAFPMRATRFSPPGATPPLRPPIA